MLHRSVAAEMTAAEVASITGSRPLSAVLQFLAALDALEHVPYAYCSVDETQVPGALEGLRTWAECRGRRLETRDIPSHPGKWVRACGNFVVHAGPEHR